MQESKLRIIIIILVIMIFIIAIGGTALYLTTDLLKSSELLFQKYISQDVQNIVDVFEISKEEKNVDLLRSSDYKEETNATLKYLEKENDEEEVYNIKEEGINKAQEKASYKNISATYGDNTIMSIDLLGQNNMYGFRLANLVQQFVSVENATIPYFVSTLGKDGTQFNETMKGVDISGILDFSDDEINKLSQTYIGLIASDIDKSHYKSKRNSLITLNNKESVTTNAYVLTLTKNEVDKIYKKILSQAINDEIILGKIDNIDGKLKEAGFSEANGNSLREKYTKNLQTIIDGLEYQGTDNRQIIITVYEEKGTTVRTTIQTEKNEFTLDVDNSNGKTLSLKTEQTTDNEKISKLYTLGKSYSDGKRDRIFTYEDSNQALNVTLNTNQTDTEIEVESNVNYKSNEINNVDFTSKTNIVLSANEAIPVNFDEKNNILLNNYEGDRIAAILENLKDRTISSLENTQGIINSKLLNNIILKIDDREQQKQKEEQDNVELKKEKFNNKFILYAGEEVELQYIEKLLETASKNMTDYQVISGTQIRILIKEGVENEQKAKEILTAIEDTRETFTVKLNYNQDGYVDSIDIIVTEKN